MSKEVRSQRPLETFDLDVYAAMKKPPEEWRRAVDATRTDLELMWATSPSADLAYAIGYCWFHMPGQDRTDSAKATEWLLRAVELESDHVFAAYYLGCNFFEDQLWDESTRWLESIPPNWFESRDLAWRERKREEMLLCVKMMTKGPQVSPLEIRMVMAIHHDDPSVEVWPLPEELVETMSRLRGVDRVAFKRLAPVLARELIATNLAEFYSEEIVEFLKA